MKTVSAFFTALLVTVAFSGVLQAYPHHSEKALWVETKEYGKLKTSLVVTENIARMVLESKDTKVQFSGKEKKELITKKMLRAVLDGSEKSISAKDPDRDEEVTIYMKDLDVPGQESGKGSLVLQTYKAGKKTFSITLPDITVESKGDDESDDLITHSFGWKALLPFLAKSGGALYVKDENDDSELWIFVE
jgi:hypothetical protein